MSKRGSKQIMGEVLDLYTNLLIPFMKIRRDMPFPTEPERNETDAEHIFSLSLIAMYLNERLGFKLNSEKVLKYALTHDLVEVYAGDISIRDQNKDTLKLKRLRERQALTKIKERFGKNAGWLVDIITDYEKRTDDEAKFVYALDKCMGALTRMAGEGARWHEAYPESDGSGYHRVIELLRSKAGTYPDLMELFDAIHGELDIRRLNYPSSERD